MIKRLFDSETYRKLGCPDLNDKMFFKKNGVKRWGIVGLVNYYGNKGKIEIGLIPFKKKTRRQNIAKCLLSSWGEERKWRIFS